MTFGLIQKLYLITKLQNLKAIHNPLVFVDGIYKLYLITKLQNLKAIHNSFVILIISVLVVSNYKITKSESYSQHGMDYFTSCLRCI